jgi:two-component system, NarL family, sensor kinase
MHNKAALHPVSQHPFWWTRDEADTHLDEYVIQRRGAISPPVALGAIINAIEHNVAVLDSEANIVAVNAAWRGFARRYGCRSFDGGVGLNYLSICDSAGEDTAKRVAADIRRLIEGKRETARRLYEMPLEGSSRRFVVYLSRFHLEGQSWILVMHRDTTHGGEEADAHIGTSERLQIAIDERRRIARELHDCTAQHIAAIRILLMLARRNLNNSSTEELINDAQHAAGEALREMRSFSYLLHPPAVGDDGLASALAAFIDGYGRRVELPIAFSVRGTEPSNLAEVEIALFRVAQEALANVHRHANATSASVELTFHDDALTLTVVDDGKGLETDSSGKAVSPGVGLASMAARVEELDGSLRLSGTRKGTRLVANIPLSSKIDATGSAT